MPDKVFLDTNILIYGYSQDEPDIELTQISREYDERYLKNRFTTKLSTLEHLTTTKKIKFFQLTS